MRPIPKLNLPMSFHGELLRCTMRHVTCIARTKCDGAPLFKSVTRAGEYACKFSVQKEQTSDFLANINLTRSYIKSRFLMHFFS